MSQEPSTAEMLRQLAREATDYGRDLVRMFSAELGEKAKSLRMLAAVAGAAALLLFFSFLFLSLALVGAIAYELDSWRWAFLIVGAGYGFLGLLALIPVAAGLRKGLLRFEHTRRRLREDAAWVKRKLAA